MSIADQFYGHTLKPAEWLNNCPDTIQTLIDKEIPSDVLLGRLTDKPSPMLHTWSFGIDPKSNVYLVGYLPDNKNKLWRFESRVHSITLVEPKSYVSSICVLTERGWLILHVDDSLTRQIERAKVLAENHEVALIHNNIVYNELLDGVEIDYGQ